MHSDIVADSDTESSAASKTVGIPELLESILVHADLKSLFVFQRVSKTFQATINRSRRIRQAMFLEHLPSEDSSPLKLNPLCRYYDRDGNCSRLFPTTIYQLSQTTVPSGDLEVHLGASNDRQWLREQNFCCEIVSLPIADDGNWRKMKAYNKPCTMKVSILGEEGNQVKGDTLGDLADYLIDVLIEEIEDGDMSEDTEDEVGDDSEDEDEDEDE